MEKNANSNDDNNKIAADNHAKKRENYQKFFQNFETEYKLIKKLTHECQYKCYNTQKSTIREAENCARICLKPYMSLRESNSKRLDNCEQNFKFNESKCLTTSKISDQLSECYRGILAQHEECLKTQIPAVQTNYKEIFADFDKLSKNEM